MQSRTSFAIEIDGEACGGIGAHPFRLGGKRTGLPRDFESQSINATDIVETARIHEAGIGGP